MLIAIIGILILKMLLRLCLLKSEQLTAFLYLLYNWVKTLLNSIIILFIWWVTSNRHSLISLRSTTGHNWALCSWYLLSKWWTWSLLCTINSLRHWLRLLEIYVSFYFKLVFTSLLILYFLFCFMHLFVIFSPFFPI